MIQAKRRDYSGPNEKEGQWKKQAMFCKNLFDAL